MVVFYEKTKKIAPIVRRWDKLFIDKRLILINTILKKSSTATYIVLRFLILRLLIIWRINTMV